MYFDNIPEELKQINNWCCYKLETKSNGKMNKIPYNAKTGYKAKSNDSTTWCSYSDATKGLEKYKLDGLGFFFSDNIFGVDIDSIELSDPIVEEVLTSLNSYAEISPSGKGIHVICEGSKPKGSCRKGNFEMYDSGRFFTMTGNVIEGYSQLNDCTESIKPLFDKYLRDKEPISTVRAYNPSISNTCALSDSEIIEKASKNDKFVELFGGGGGSDKSASDLALLNILAYWTRANAQQMDSIFRSSGLMREKWDRKQSGSTYGAITISKCLRTYSGGFYDPDYYKSNSKKKRNIRCN